MKTKTQPTESNLNPLSWWGDVQEKSSVLARWMSLYEAVNIIADKAAEKKIPFDKVELSPLDIRDYMSATEDIYMKKILETDYKITVCYPDDASPFVKNLSEDEVEVDLRPM
jgi:hypothetical protein